MQELAQPRRRRRLGPGHRAAARCLGAEMQRQNLGEEGLHPFGQKRGRLIAAHGAGARAGRDPAGHQRDLARGGFGDPGIAGRSHRAGIAQGDLERDPVGAQHRHQRVKRARQRRHIGRRRRRSLSGALADAYERAARAAGHDLRRRDLHALEFDPDFGAGRFAEVKPLEPALETFIADLHWAGHLVLVSPLWWGGLPARLKGLFDRALLPGNSFDPRRRRMGFPVPLLGGRSARVMITADTPGWALRLLYRGAIQVQLARQILGFVGIRPTRFSHFAAVEHAGPEEIGKWLAEAARLGRAGG